MATSGRRKRQGGNHILEGALVLIPLFAMLVGIVDVALAIFIRNTMQHAVREGTRYAVTYQTMSGMGQDASIKTIVQQNAMGFLAGTSGADKVTVRYYNPTTLAEVTGTGSNAPGNIVEISIENYTRSWITTLIGNLAPIDITVRSSDRMEGLASGTSAPTR